MEGGTSQFSHWYRDWFDRVHDVAFHIVRDPSVSAEVTRDVFIDAWHDLDRGEDAVTGGGLLRNARTRALNRLSYDRRNPANHRAAAKVAVERRKPGIDAGSIRIDIDRRHRVLRAVAAALGDRDASILSLHLRNGLDAPELAEELGVSAADAPPVLARLRTGLHEAVAAWICWNDGAPVCAELQELVDRDRLTAFDRETAKAVTTHVDWCDTCTTQYRRSEPPEEIYADVPVLVAPAALRHDVTIALERSGILMPATTEPSEVASDPSPSRSDSSARSSEPNTERRNGRRPQATFLAVGVAAILLALVFVALRVGLG